MKKNNVIDLRNLPEVDLLTQLIQGGVRQLVAQAMEAEVEVFISAVAERLEDGRSRVVRNRRAAFFCSSIDNGRLLS